jgi:hypothetical protein
MSDPFLCEKCHREILPGDNVIFTTLDGEELRIIYNDDYIVVHETCEEVTT